MVWMEDSGQAWMRGRAILQRDADTTVARLGLQGRVGWDNSALLIEVLGSENLIRVEVGDDLCEAVGAGDMDRLAAFREGLEARLSADAT